MIPLSKFTRGCGLLSLLIIAGTARAGDFDHSHALLDKLLQARVKNELVDYAALKADSRDLDAYLAQCAAVTEASYDWSLNDTASARK